MSEIFSTLWQPGMTAWRVAGSSSMLQTRSAGAPTLASPSPRRRRSPLRGAIGAGGTTCRWRRLGAAHERRELCRHQRQLDVFDPQRIGDGVGDADRRRHAIAFADALRSQRREWRRRLHVENERIGHLRRGRQQIVGKAAGQKTAVGGVGVFLIECGADRLGKTAANLSVDHGRMQDGPAVMHGDVAVDPRLQGGPIDLDAAEIEDEAVAERGVDMVVFVRCGQLRRASRTRFRGSSGRCRRAAPQATSGSAPASRENDTLLSGLRFDPTLPPANPISSISVFNWLAAMRASRSAMRSAASLAVPATAGAKRLA